jgi:hypothetical protein
VVASAATRLEFDPAAPEDAAFHARVYTASAPDEPVPPEAVLAAWRARPEAERFTIRAGRQPVGLAAVALEDWARSELRAARLEADLLPAARSHYALGVAFDFIEERARVAGAEHLVTHARESDDLLVLNLRRRGYAGKVVFEWWETELEKLSAGEPELPAGIHLERLDRARIDLDQDARLELSWVALRGGTPVAVAAVSGGDGANAWLELAAPEGAVEAAVARALELRAIGSAAEAGLRRLRTEAPQATLAGRRAGGWVRIPGMIEFHVSVAERDRRRANPRI